jgi:hypothetical protein
LLNPFLNRHKYLALKWADLSQAFLPYLSQSQERESETAWEMASFNQMLRVLALSIRLPSIIWHLALSQTATHYFIIEGKREKLNGFLRK